MPDGWSLLGRRVCDNLLSAAVENIIYLAPKLPGKFQGLLSVGIKMFDEVSNLITTAKPAVHKQPEVSQFDICVNGHDGSSTNPVRNQVRIFSIKEKTALTILGGDFVKVINKYKTDIASEENPDDITSDVNVSKYIGTLLDLVEEPFKVKGVQDDIKTPVLNLIGRIRDTASEIRYWSSNIIAQLGATSKKAVVLGGAHHKLIRFKTQIFTTHFQEPLHTG